MSVCACVRCVRCKVWVLCVCVCVWVCVGVVLLRWRALFKQNNWCSKSYLKQLDHTVTTTDTTADTTTTSVVPLCTAAHTRSEFIKELHKTATHTWHGLYLTHLGGVARWKDGQTIAKHIYQAGSSIFGLACDWESIVCATADGHIDCIDLSGNRLWRSTDTICSLQGVVMDRDQNIAVTVSQQNSINVWDLDTGKSKCKVVLNGFEGGNGMWAVKLWRNRTVLTAAMVSKKFLVQVHDLDTLAQKASFDTGHSDTIWRIDISGDKLVTGSNDSFVALWDIEAAASIAKLKHTAGIVTLEYKNDMIDGLVEYSLKEIHL
eukprot:TRINITY_DN7799_c0_g1_i1.p1 TRINITY_DN7799_c0_g1~~TRINITY_DN7799_c0_g1_i1.p1  ORF type:complete len:319 (-),score=29.92 TRINITY_DN7799_c0_g1_i1:47-1003(-)